MSVKIKGCVNVDAEKFLNDFLELQDQACGPTVDEFMQALHIPTYALFGLTNEDWHLDKGILVKGNKIYSEDGCVIMIDNEVVFEHIPQASCFGNNSISDYDLLKLAFEKLGHTLEIEYVSVDEYEGEEY